MLEGPTLTYFTAEHGTEKGKVGDEACMACMGLRGKLLGQGEGLASKKPVCDSPFGASACVHPSDTLMCVSCDRASLKTSTDVVRWSPARECALGTQGKPRRDGPA